MKPKTNIGNTTTMGQILEFEVAFPGEEKQPIEKYLFGGNKGQILNAAAFFLGFKNHNSKFDDNRRFLGMFFREENKEIANQIYRRIDELEKRGIRIGIINAYSSLKLFEYFFSMPEAPETQTKAEFEVNLFKAYLIQNSEFTQLQKAAFDSTRDLEVDLKFPMMTFCLQYPVSDKLNYDIRQIWATQMIKAIYLFQFLEAHDKTKSLLDAFLTYFNSPTWQDYLKKLIPLTTPPIEKENEAHTDIIADPGENFEQSCSFIEKLIVKEQDALDPNDFLTIRAKPFYKVEDGVYRIIFDLFVVEKIFKGIYFSLRDVNKALPRAQRIKEIRSFYGDEFSEKILCYKVIESIYPDKCIRFSDKELSDMEIDGSPDYYVRKGKNILLFESKDFLIAADKKMSFDFNVYDDEFSRILDFMELEDGKIKPKAVTQLINNIRKLLKNEFPADTDYYYKDIYIYPILLTHDHQYDVLGFNELIDSWFQEALSELKAEGLFTHHVKPLSVVNIDSLIYNQKGLSDSIHLHKMLELYHENKKIRKPIRKIKSREEYEKALKELGQTKTDKLIPFSMFIEKYFQKHGLWESPPMLELIAPALFKEQFETREATIDKLDEK